VYRFRLDVSNLNDFGVGISDLRRFETAKGAKKSDSECLKRTRTFGSGTFEDLGQHGKGSLNGRLSYPISRKLGKELEYSRLWL
jgi:hypothetical protein